MVANNALKKRIFTLLCNSSPVTLQVIVTLTITEVIHFKALVTHSSPKTLYLVEYVENIHANHSSPLVNVFRVTSELITQIVMYQDDTYAWVMSGWRVKWNESPLQLSDTENFMALWVTSWRVVWKFFFLRLILFCLYCKSQVIPMWFPCNSHFSPIIGNGLGTDLQRIYNGPGTEVERN